MWAVSSQFAAMGNAYFTCAHNNIFTGYYKIDRTRCLCSFDHYSCSWFMCQDNWYGLRDCFLVSEVEMCVVMSGGDPNHWHSLKFCMYTCRDHIHRSYYMRREYRVGLWDCKSTFCLSKNHECDGYAFIWALPTHIVDNIFWSISQSMAEPTQPVAEMRAQRGKKGIYKFRKWVNRSSLWQSSDGSSSQENVRKHWQSMQIVNWMWL